MQGHMNVWGWCDPEDAQDRLIRHRDSENNSRRSASQRSRHPVPTPAATEQPVERRRDRDRSSRWQGNVTRHSGLVPSIKPMAANPEDAQITATLLENLRNNISCPGILNETWLAYRNFEQKKPSEVKVPSDPLSLVTHCWLDSGAHREVW